jgi:hypothetical protein
MITVSNTSMTTTTTMGTIVDPYRTNARGNSLTKSRSSPSMTKSCKKRLAKRTAPNEEKQSDSELNSSCLTNSPTLLENWNT